MSGWKDLVHLARNALADQREADSLVYPKGCQIWTPAELKPFHAWLEPFEREVAEGLGLIVGLKAYLKLPASQREETLNRVSELVAHVFACEPPVPVVVAGPRRASFYVEGLIVMDARVLDDQRTALFVALHESMHGFQKKAVDRWRRGEVSAQDPLAAIAPVWAYNQQHYLTPERGRQAYERQPVEFHANRFAQRVIDRLDWISLARI